MDYRVIPRLVDLVNAGEPMGTRRAAEALFMMMTSPSTTDPVGVLGRFLESPTEKTVAVAEDVFYRVLFFFWTNNRSPKEGDALLEQATTYSGNLALMEVGLKVGKRFEDEYRYGL